MQTLCAKDAKYGFARLIDLARRAGLRGQARAPRGCRRHRRGVREAEVGRHVWNVPGKYNSGKGKCAAMGLVRR